MKSICTIFSLILLFCTTSAQAADARTIIAAGSAITESIKGLGADATERQISNLVYSAVKAQPDAVLQIVHAAVKCSPDSVAGEIAAAAIAGVPDPWRHVIYYPPTARMDKGGRDFKGDTDSKNIVNPEKPGSQKSNRPDARSGNTATTGGPDAAGRGGAFGQGGNGFVLGPDSQKINQTGQVVTLDGTTLGSDSAALGPNGEVLGIDGVVLGPESIGTNGGGIPNGGISMTLAQAIAQAVFDTRPGVDHPSVLAAIDLALASNPSRMQQTVAGSRGISAVGDRGNPNYANEPRRPTPHPVSR